MKRFTILLLVVVLAFVFVITAFAAPQKRKLLNLMLFTHFLTAD